VNEPALAGVKRTNNICNCKAAMVNDVGETIENGPALTLTVPLVNGPNGIRERETSLSIGTHCDRAKIDKRRGNSQLGRSKATATDSIGPVAAIAQEYNCITKVARYARLKLTTTTPVWPPARLNGLPL